MKRLLPLLLLAACSAPSNPPEAPASPSAPVADPDAAPAPVDSAAATASLAPPESPALGAEDLRDELSVQAYSFPLPAGPTDPLVALREAARAAFPDYAVESEVPEEPRPGTLVVRQVPVEPFAEDFLTHYGRGLDDAGLALARDPERNVLLVVLAPAADALAAQLAGTTVAFGFALAQGGLVFDEGTRELFGRTAFRKQRELALEADAPVLRDTITWHAYRDGPLIRIVSLGLDRWGLPDLVLEGVPASDATAALDAANWLAEALHRKPTLGAGGTVVLDPAASPVPWVDELLGERKASGQAVTVRLEVAEHKEGDSPNRLLALRFDADAPEGTDVERLTAALNRLFGAGRGPIAVGDDRQEALDAAMARARDELPQRKAEWPTRSEGDTLLVKAAFDTAADHTEYMWVEVLQWSGATVRGLLHNTPRFGERYRVGQEITLPEAEVVDYHLIRADGSELGAYTTAVLEGR